MITLIEATTMWYIVIFTPTGPMGHIEFVNETMCEEKLIVLRQDIRWVKEGLKFSHCLSLKIERGPSAPAPGLAL